MCGIGAVICRLCITPKLSVTDSLPVRGMLTSFDGANDASDVEPDDSQVVSALDRSAQV